MPLPEDERALLESHGALSTVFSTPTLDLAVPGFDGPVTPRDYLESGGDIAQVVLLAKGA